MRTKNGSVRELIAGIQQAAEQEEYNPAEDLKTLQTQYKRLGKKDFGLMLDAMVEKYAAGEYEARRQTYLKAIENLLGIKRGILSDAEAVSKTATEINSSAGDYSLSIMDFQHLYYDALQAALRLGDQIGQAYRLCDASAWDADELAVTWGNGVLYDADQEWTERKELVQMGLLKPELALAWKFDLPAETEADLAEIRKNYMPELKDLEG